MDSQSFNIAIIPPKVVADRVIEVNRVFGSKGGLFVLDGVAYHPHITLYMTQFPVKNLPQIIDVLTKTLMLQPSFTLHSMGYRNNSYAYIDIEYESSSLLKLQSLVISKINTFREGTPLPYTDVELSQMNSQEHHNVETYGTRNVGAAYTPHLTVTRLPDYSETALEGLETQDFSFDVTRIGLFRLGEHGTCRELLHTFELKDRVK